MALLLLTHVSLTLDLSSSRIQVAALGHTSTPFCFVTHVSSIRNLSPLTCGKVSYVLNVLRDLWVPVISKILKLAYTLYYCNAETPTATATYIAQSCPVLFGMNNPL